MTRALRLSGLTKDYGRTRALDAIDLDVEAGEVFGYLGPNGAGKTTTIRIVMGLLRPTAGRAEVLGLDAWRDAARLHGRVGYLPGEPGLYDRMSGAAVVEHFARLRRDRAAPRRARELAERLDLDLHPQVRALSRGNLQKLGLVQALMSHPDLVVLDEPTNGLDPLVQHVFHQLVREVTARGTTVLLSSHVLSEVQRLADRVGIIRQGHLVAVERLDDLRAKSLHHVEARFAGPVDPSVFGAVPGVRRVDFAGGVLRCAVPATSLDAMVKTLGRFRVHDVTIAEADLEETFLAYYEEQAARAG